MQRKRTTIQSVEGRFVVRAGGAIIADTSRALEYEEEGSEPVILFPKEDIGMMLLELADTAGDDGRQIYGIAGKSGLIGEAAWAYENPPAELAALRGYVAFDPAKATVEET